jgi:hypothetical protein
MGYKVEVEEKSSGPINSIMIDQEHGTLWSGSSDYGEDYGIGWRGGRLHTERWRRIIRLCMLTATNLADL